MFWPKGNSLDFSMERGLSSVLEKKRSLGNLLVVKKGDSETPRKIGH